MNWFQSFKSLLSKAAGATQSNLKLVPEWRRWGFGEFSFSQVMNEGYRVNSAVFSCMRALAFSFPEAPLLCGFETEGKFTTDYSDPLMALIRQPNPDMGEAEFMAFVITCAALGGECNIWKQRNDAGEVIAHWPFSIVNMWAVPGESTAEGFVKCYEYKSQADQKPIRIRKNDVIQWKWMPDPENPHKGMGAVQACAREVGKDNEANAYIYSLLKNNAVPPIVITLTEDDELTPVKADRLRKEWGNVYGKGGAGEGGPAFLEYGMKAEKLGFDMQQLAAEALSAVPEARIAGNFGVPPVVAGLSVGLKRSDYGDQAARRSFTELTLAALWRFFASEMWASYKDDRVKGQGDKKRPVNFAMQFNLRVVRALQEDETKRWETATSAFERSGITRAEMKIYLGIEPKQGDDVYKVSLASEFVEAGQTVVRDPAKEAPQPLRGIPPFQSAKQGDKGHALKASSQRVAAVLRKQRVKLAGKMKKDVQGYFDDLAADVVKNAENSKSKKDSTLPSVDELMAGNTTDELGKILKRYYATMLEISWDTWNLELGVELAFDLTDPMVRRVLAGSGKSIRDIEATTRDALRSALQYGEENGFSIDDLVRGKDGQPGLRDLIEQTYKGRAENISRTELGDAQNSAAAERYGKAGVEKVVILDNGSDDDDDECKVANGQIWTLAYFMDHMLEHPSCTRAAAAYFGDAEPDQG